jgi:quercetin dioxygenase-like cupin family protein
MRRIATDGIEHPHFGQVVLSDALTFSRLILGFWGILPTCAYGGVMRCTGTGEEPSTAARPSEDLATEALSAGSQGFVVKSHMGTDLRLAIAEVLAGRIFISSVLCEKLLKKDEQKRAEGESQRDEQAIQVLLDHSGLLISRTETAGWQAGRAPGCWAKTLFVEKESSIATSLIRMDPGTHFPRHRHAGAEEVFLLEGDLVVEGQKMKPGDYCRAESGSTHSESYTESGCVFLLKASQLDETL